jgi:renalase
MIDITIVGAGITAIAYAKLHPLKKILILEKSRGIGGRIATRRLGDTWIDHGAEKIKGEDHLFQSYNPEFSTSQWIKSLAADLEIKKECRVEKIVKTSEGVEIWDDQKQLVCTTKEVIITAPAPQAKDILEASGFISNIVWITVEK